MYFPHAQLSDGFGTHRDAADGVDRAHERARRRAVAAAVQQTLREETGPCGHRHSVARGHVARDRSSQQRLNLWLMTIFGGAALLLGAVGIYGLVAYSVQRRQHEIGIRLAVGARPDAVRNMVISEGMQRVVAGIVIGVVAAYLAANLLAAVLFGVEPHDVAVFVTVPLVLAAVGLTAVCVPALRATRVDPTRALRSS